MRTNLKFRAGAIVGGMYTYTRIFYLYLLLGRLLLARRSLLPPGYSLLLPSGRSLLLPSGYSLLLLFASGYSLLLASGYSLLSTRLLPSGLLLPTS